MITTTTTTTTTTTHEASEQNAPKRVGERRGEEAYTIWM